jgi:hypothetical protein
VHIVAKKFGERLKILRDQKEINSSVVLPAIALGRTGMFVMALMPQIGSLEKLLIAI